MSNRNEWPVNRVSAFWFAAAANGAHRLMLLKKSLLQRGKACSQNGLLRPRQAGTGRVIASLRRFWTVAAIVNSSFAPFGPLRRSRVSPRIRFRCAKSISTFFLA
jgi:hypothetical protein